MFKENQTLNIVCAVGIFAAAILIAWLVSYVSRLVKRKLSSRKLASTVSIAIDSAAVPVVLLIIVEGLILALMSVNYLEDWHPVLTKVSIGAVIVVATYGLARIFESLLNWQLTRLKEHSKKPINLGAVLFLKNIAKWIIYVLGCYHCWLLSVLRLLPCWPVYGIGGALWRWHCSQRWKYYLCRHADYLGQNGPSG
jgi:uncharacterized membrane protein